MGIAAILNGHTNELLGLNKNISIPRLKRCSRCPLYKKTVVLRKYCVQDEKNQDFLLRTFLKNC